MTITSNVPPPPRLTGEANVDLAAIVAWAYAMYRVLATDDGGLTGTLATLRTDLDALTVTLIALQNSTATDLQALADAINALTLRLDAIASITPVPPVFVANDLRLAINAIITAAA
jgi:hypothetical protein